MSARRLKDYSRLTKALVAAVSHKVVWTTGDLLDVIGATIRELADAELLELQKEVVPAKATNDEAKARQRAYYEKNKERIKAYQREYSKTSDRAARRRRERANRPTNAYIAAMLGLSVHEATPELIEAKREQLLLQRLSNQLCSTIGERGQQ